MLEELVGGFRRPSHEEHFGRRYEHHMSSGNHGRRPMTNMGVCDEDSDGEFYPSHGNSHGNFLHSGPGTQPHHMPHGGHGMQPHGGHGMPHLGGHGMPHLGGHGMPHHDSHGIQHHGGHGMQNYGGHGMQHHGGGHMMQQHDTHGMMHHGVHGMHGGGGRTEVVKVSEKWQANGGGNRRSGWGSKGL